MLSETQITLVEDSFEQVNQRQDQFVKAFYERFFDAHPRAEALFEDSDMQSQRRKLLIALVMIVDNLRNPEVLRRSLHNLGEKHIKMGLSADDFAVFRDVLIATLRQTIPERWSPAHEAAWRQAFQQVSEHMLEVVGTS